MKRFFELTGALSVAFVLVAILAAGALKPFEQQLGGNPINSFFPMQEAKSFQGDSVKAYLAGAPTAWPVVDLSAKKVYAKGIRVTTGATAGNIVVHLVDNPAGAYDTYDFEAGDKEGLVFDTLIEAGTTIDLDSVKILL